MSTQFQQEVIGFDLGHAHTTLASVMVAAHQPKVLEITKRKVQTTALKRRPNTKHGSQNSYTILFGDRVFNHVPPEEELHLAFKAKPSNNPLYMKNMAEFFSAVLEDIRASGQVQDWANVSIIVGCPSHWEEEDRKRYQSLLATPAFPQPQVISESRAALLNAIAPAEVAITQDDLRDSVLIVDVGSSTVDLTLIHGLQGEEPLCDFGAEIGGAFFDEEIYRCSVERYPDPDHLRLMLQLNRNLEPKLIYKCRKAKEKYFESPEDWEASHVPGFAEEISVGRYFEPIVSGETMAHILQKPTKSGQPWIETFEGQLRKAQQEANAKGYPVKVVVLTGGAARMGFVTESIRRVFPEQTTKLIQDSEPETSVAKGLAIWGRGDILVRSFEATIDELFQSHIPALLREKQPHLLSLLIPSLVEKVINDFVIPEMLAWKAGRYSTLQELKTVISTRATEWLASPAGQQFRIDVANRWWNESVRKEFQALVDPVCKAHDVPVGSLDIRVPFQLDRLHYEELEVPIPLGPMLRIIGYVIFWAIVWVLPLGGPILAAFITMFFKEEIDHFIDENMEKLSLPGFLRKTVSDDKIYQVGVQNGQQMAKQMEQKMSQDENFGDSLHASLIAQLSDDIDRAIRKIAVRLYSGK